MGYPELDKDEPVILESRNITYNSISFDAVLTSRRIHLTASKKNVIPPRDILLTTIRNVETGENAIRDHFLKLSFITESGEQRQEVLTFARKAGLERKRECNEWAKKLTPLIPPKTPETAPSAAPEVEKEPLKKREVPTPAQATATSISPAHKKVLIVQPAGMVSEKTSGTPEPSETTPLYSGSFCARCGNRIPLKSTFCSHCGTPVQQPERPGQEPRPGVSVRPRQPEPVTTKIQETVQPPVPKPVGTKEPEKVQPPSSKPVAPKIQETIQHPVPKPVGTKEPEKVQPPASKPVTPKIQETIQSPVPKPGVSKGPERVQPPVPKPGVTKEPEKVTSPASKPVIPKIQETIQSPVPKPGVSKGPERVQPPVPKLGGTKEPEKVQPPASKPVTTKVQETIQSPVPKPGGTQEPEKVTSPASKPVAPKIQETIQPPVPKPGVTKESEKVTPPASKPVTPKIQETIQPPVPKPGVSKGPEKVQSSVPEPVPPKIQETIQFPVLKPGGTQEPEKVQPPISQPVVSPVSQPVVIQEQETVQPPAGSSEERQEKSTELLIPSLEPQIKASAPGARHSPAPVQVLPSRQQSEPSSPGTHAEPTHQVVWPVFSPAEFPAAPARKEPPASPPPPLSPSPERRKTSTVAIGIIIIAILPILVGLIIGANLLYGPSGGPAITTPAITLATTIPTQVPLTTSTPSETATPVPESTPVQIPSSGVWVRVTYPGTYTGFIGTTGDMSEVTDTGDQFYLIPLSARTVTASVEKKDGSGDQILLEVYRDGVMLRRESSITPNGIVEIQLDLTTV